MPGFQGSAYIRSPPSVTKQKLLLIDDSSMIAAATRLLLRGTDLELWAAQSGEDGLVQAETLRPDLILLDVHMPGIDGFETCRRVRAESWGVHVPIVMASAHIGDREREIGTAAGCTAHASA
jgi:CheY-like chemotaxis protein